MKKRDRIGNQMEKRMGNGNSAGGTIYNRSGAAFALSVVIAIVAATVYIVSQLSSMSAVVTQLSDSKSMFVDFMNEGGRFTKEDSERIIGRLDALENWKNDPSNFPPGYYKETIDEFKKDTRDEIRNHRDQLANLEGMIRALQYQFEFHQKAVEDSLWKGSGEKQ